MFNGEFVKAAEEDMRKVRGEKISMIFQDPHDQLESGPYSGETRLVRPWSFTWI